jgi:excisionase family DNA binding protein
MPETLLSVSEAAKILQVAPMTVYRYVASGDLPAVRIGRRSIRFSPESLQQYIATGGTPAGSQGGSRT